MRLGKFVEHFKAAAIAADAKNLDPVLKYLAVGRQLGYAMYLSLDALTYLDQTGIKKFSAGARLQREAYRAWFTGLTCNILAGVYTLYNMRQLEQQQAARSEDAEKKMESKKLEKYAYSREIHCRVRGLTSGFLGRERLSSCSCCRTCAISPFPAARSDSLTWTTVLWVWLVP